MNTAEARVYRGSPPRLRVLWLIKGLGPGGAEHLLAAAAEHGDHTRFDYSVAYLLDWKTALVERIEAAGVPTRCLGVRSERDLRWIWRLRTFVKSGDFDIVHVHSPLVAGVARLVVLTMRRRPAIVSSEHNSWSSHKRGTRWLNRATIGLDDANIAVSEPVVKSLPPKLQPKCQVIVYGVDRAMIANVRRERDAVRAELGLKPDQVAVCTVANLRWQKGYPDLLAAAKTVIDAGHDVVFLAVGQGPLESELRERHATLGLGDRFRFLGYRSDAIRILAGSDIFALASLYEGYPIALMEALTVGLPTVATDVGGVPLAIRDGLEGFVVRSQHPEELAAALERLVADEELRRRMSESAVERSARYEINSSIAQTEEVYVAVATRERTSMSRHAATDVTMPLPQPAPVRRPPPAGLDIRPAVPDDRPAIIELCRTSLGWGDDPRFEQLFSWKHDQNAFGPSYMWVATDADRVVGLRAFMRWEFVRGDKILRAVRAVDTATHPDYQGRGLFTAMTMHGLDEVRAAGVDFVFNTPNDKSRPGYLKMGWQEVGQLPVAMRPAGVGGAIATLRSKVASSHWPIDIAVGYDIHDVVGQLPLEAPGDLDSRQIATRLSPAFYAWRYGADFLGYRAVRHDEGFVLVRMRERGQGREFVVLGAAGLGLDAMDKAAGSAMRAVGATHAVRLGGGDARHGFVPVPRLGPTLTWRSVNQKVMPPLGDWRLTMGDVELF